jgi:DNA processing protein
VIPITERKAAGWKRLDPENLAALLVLDELPFFGPQKFREIFARGVSPAMVLAEPSLIADIGGNRAATFVEHLRGIADGKLPATVIRATRLLRDAERLDAMILSYGDEAYPAALYASNYPIPVLYARGAADVLAKQSSVAAVGSRGIRPPYSDLHARFARAATAADTVVVSGFALGADSIGHRTAVETGGSTIGVMAGGVDRPFPPENRTLWTGLLAGDRAVFVSEAPFGARASSLTLRRRNKLIVALSRGVLVSQSAADGGAMNAFRFALEDHKPVSTFVPDDTNDTTGNRAIAEDARSGGRVFGLDSGPREFGDWLAELASLT